MKIVQSVLITSIVVSSLFAQQRGDIISFDFLEFVSADSLNAEIQQQTGFPGSLLGIAYDINVFKVKYYTLDYLPSHITMATGIVAFPENYPCDELALLTFGHGLAVKDWEAPSNNDNVYSMMAKGMGANGFIGIAPDYIHLGPDASPGFQAFMHSETEAAATIDLVRAVRSYCAQNNIELSGQIFLAGYSQGGHSALATAREMQDSHADEFTVTACVAGGGTYDLSGIAADSLLSTTRITPEPHAMCLIVRSYLEIYRDSLVAYGLPENPIVAFDSIFKYPYDSLLELMLQRDNNYWFTLDSIPIRMIEANFSNRFRNEPDFFFRKFLSYNDLYEWTPLMPVVLYQSDTDIEDPIANTYATLQQFLNRGAPNVKMEVISGLSHQQAALPYALYAKSYFEKLRIDCLNPVQVENIYFTDMQIYPNPASTFIRVAHNMSPTRMMVRIYNAELKPVMHSIIYENQIDVQTLPAGIFLLELNNGNGHQTFKMFVKQ